MLELDRLLAGKRPPQKPNPRLVLDDEPAAGLGRNGQGTGTGFRQLMSDELDIAFDRTACIMGSTDTTVDQVGSGGSTAMERDSWPMRRVAAEARRVLLEMASARSTSAHDRVQDHRSKSVLTPGGDGFVSFRGHRVTQPTEVTDQLGLRTRLR